MKHLTYLIAVMALLAVGQIAQGAVYQSCDQWASYSDGTYTVWNNVWGATGSWSQCLTCTSATQWYIDASHTNGSQVKSYANTSRGVKQTIGNLSSFSSTMSTSTPGTGTYNISWDIWAPGEVMVWLARYGGAAPWGSYVSTQTIGGRTWDVYKNGYPGFLTQSNTSGATVDMKAILDYCVSQGWLSSGNTVDNLGGGFEIWDSAGATRRWTMNSFSASFSTGGSTSTTAASTTTTAATTTTTAASTSTTTSGGGCTVTPYVQVNGGTWQQTTNVTVSSGATVKFGPQPTSGGTWSWNGGCGTSGSSREQTIYPTSSCSATATFSPSGGGSCSATFNVTVSGGSTSTTTTASSTSTTTTASSTSTTSATTTTTSGGSCSCGTCSWWGSQIPTCCQSCSGWGWQDGGCNRSCVCSGSCPNN